jgi:tetratricopeptide (TPR) repeat protein
MKFRFGWLLFILMPLLITVGCAHNKTIEGLNAADWLEMSRQANIDNRLDKALDALNKAIELDPENTDLYIYRGRTYYYLGNYTQAIIDYDKFIKFDPENTETYLNRGNIILPKNWTGD